MLKVIPNVFYGYANDIGISCVAVRNAASSMMPSSCVNYKCDLRVEEGSYWQMLGILEHLKELQFFLFLL